MPGSVRWRTRRLPRSHQNSVRPVSSRILFGSEKKIWQETENTCSSVNPSNSGCRKSASTRMSLFSSTTTSCWAAANPALEPPPKPRFVASATTRTCGKRSWMNAALPSVEPLSTTMTSLPGTRSAAAITEGRYLSRRSRPFQLGMTIAAEPVSGRVSWLSLRGWARRANRSVTASPTAAMNSSNGERIARGSPERIRQKAPDLPDALAPATARVTLAVEIRTQVQLAAKLGPARCAPEIEASREVLHLCRHSLRPKCSLNHHRFRGGQFFKYGHQVAAHRFQILASLQRPAGLLLRMD